MSLKDWTRAERAASTARDVAARREENRVVLEADAVLDQVARKRALETEIEPAGGEEEAAESDILAADLLRMLAVARR